LVYEFFLACFFGAEDTAVGEQLYLLEGERGLPSFGNDFEEPVKSRGYYLLLEVFDLVRVGLPE